MSTENDVEPDLNAAFEASQSGRGGRLDGVERLKLFAAYTRSRARVICNVETFEVRGDLEVPRIDLSIYRGGREDYERRAAEWTASCEQELQDVLDAIETEGVDCVFQLWTDQLSA